MTTQVCFHGLTACGFCPATTRRVRVRRCASCGRRARGDLCRSCARHGFVPLALFYDVQPSERKAVA